MYFSNLAVIVIGFVETLVEVDESDGQATLNVSISFPEFVAGLQFQIMFRLNANMMDITAGMGHAYNFLNDFHNYCALLFYVQVQDQLQLVGLIL